MSREALVSNTDMSERGERVRFSESLAVFEEMHRSLKERVTETPEHRALVGLDAALALVAASTRAAHLDLDGFSAFRGSVEILHDNTPEARALELFEGALRSMIASASDFDDLPDEEEEDDIAADDSDEAIADETPVIVTIYDAEAPAAEAAPEAGAENEAEDEPVEDAPSDDAEHEAEPATNITELHADQAVTQDDTMGAAHDAVPETEAVADADIAPAEIQHRIEELEAELAAARAHQAA